MRLVLALMLLAPQVHAMRVVAPVVTAPFVPGYLGTLALSLKSDAFYASRLLGSLGTQLKAVAPLRDPQQVAAYLQAEILASAGPRASLSTVSDRLGREVLDARTAAAVLLANVLVRPEQAHEVLAGMERMRPAWGQHAAHVIGESGPGVVSPKFAQMLESLAVKVRPLPNHPTYNSAGHLNGLFDGRR